jgi:hypothetical protein
MPGQTSKLRLIHEPLGVFHTATDGERLALQRQPQRMQHGEGVAGAVPHGHDDAGRCDGFAVSQAYAATTSLPNSHGIHASAKAPPAAQAYDLLPECGHHAAEAIGSDMGLVPPQNVLRRPMGHKLRQHLAAASAPLLDLRGELAIGKGAGPTFAELDVGLRVKGLATPKGVHLPSALLNGPPALQQLRRRIR